MFLRLTSSSGSQLLQGPASTGGLRLGGVEPVPLLKAVAAAARELLTADFDAGLRGALRALSEGARMDRVYVVRYDHTMAAGFFVADHCAPGVDTVTARFGAGPYNYADFEEVWRPLMSGIPYGYRRSDTVGANLVSIGETATKSSCLVPIVVSGSFWGAIGFDDCYESSVCAAHEIAILQSAAACIAAALERREMERTRLDAEKERTDEALELNRLMEGVVDASRALLEAPSFEEGLQRWLEYLAEGVDADHSMLGGFPSTDDGRSAAFSVHVWEKAGRPPDPEVIVPDTRDFREWAKRLAAGETIWAHRDELTDPASVEFWEKLGCYTDLIVPIVWDRRTVGWLSFSWTSRREWKQSYVTLLRAAADGAAAAINQNEVACALLAEREARAADLTRANQAMRRAIAGLASLSELDVFLADMLRESIAAVGAEGGAVELLDGTEIQHRIAIGRDGVLSPEAMEELGSTRMPAPPDLLAAVAALEHDHVITGLDPTSSAGPPDIREHQRAEDTRRFTVVPLRVGTTVLGWMGLLFDAPVELSSDKVALLRVLGDQMTLALQLCRLAQEAQSAATQTAVLSERNRLARDLHDTLAQGFAGVIAQLGAVEGAIELKQWDEATAYFERARRLARFSLAEARSSVHALRAETNAGPLRQRLERMVSAMTHGTGLDSLVHEGGTPVELSLKADWCAYKFVQEALANAVKHAGAKQFVVELVWDADRLKMCAIDNGRGFELEKVREGLGFLSMRERAGEVGGEFRHEAQPGGGTRLCLELPLRTKDLS
jgi:signal transduction histidine kinase